MLPSLYRSGENAQAWSVAHAAACGAGIGALAAVFKTLGPLHTSSAAATFAHSATEIAGVAVAFAFLCAGAAALRNILARRFVWDDDR